MIRFSLRVTESLPRKATDSGRYLHYASNHPRSVKVGVAVCLLKRAHFENKKEKEIERQLVVTTLKKNRYP
jgi:hypothetical protein